MDYLIACGTMIERAKTREKQNDMNTYTVNIPALPTLDPPEPPGPPGTMYSIDELIPSYIAVYATQAEYQQKTGQSAPAYNPTFPIKGWIDSRKPAAIMSYFTIHLDPSGQNAVETQISVPGYLAGVLNLPPDSGNIPPSNAGAYLTPRRQLQPDEKLVSSPFAQGDAVVEKIAVTPPVLSDHQMIVALYNKLVLGQ